MTNDTIPTVDSKPSSFRLFLDRLHAFMGVDKNNSVMRKLAKRIISFSLAFAFISAFIPLYHLTAGHHMQDYDNYVYPDFMSQETDTILDDIMTEDGFLLKPALNSAQGDRSTANEIFAYEVEAGDTLSSLAQRFGIKKETIIMENNLWNANSLRSGMILKILPVDGISHVIKKGDTVASIAKKYKVEAEVIMRQNQLEEGDELIVDSALIIPGAKKEVQPPAYTGSSAPASGAAYQYTGTATGRLIWPTLTKAKITQGFHRGHYAIDIGSRSKGPIFAAAAGRVVSADYGWNGGYGNVIIIDHGDGMQTLYAHNEKLYVSKGQYVEQGQTIAWMGRTGRVYGPTGIHLHFEVRINGVKYNPMNFF